MRHPLVPVNVSGSGVYGDSDRSKVHVCGRCRNPFTRAGNPECPNNIPDETPVEYELEPIELLHCTRDECTGCCANCGHCRWLEQDIRRTGGR